MTLHDLVDRPTANYYLDIAMTLVCGVFAGLFLLADHPELAEPGLRAALVALWTVFAIKSTSNAARSWVRMHGYSAVGIEMGFAEGEPDDPPQLEEVRDP